MHVLVSCKNEEDQIKNEGARVFKHFSHFYGKFFMRPKAANSAVHNPIRFNLELSPRNLQK